MVDATAGTTMSDYTITSQTTDDEQFLDPLLDLAFGKDRIKRPSYTLREGVLPIDQLCFTVKASNGELLASLRFWPISIEGEKALLLGPLAVNPTLQGKGIGRALVKRGLEQAKKMGYRLCFVVGEQCYYAPYGFERAPPFGYDMPVPVSAEKFQVLALQGDSLSALPKGMMQPWVLEVGSLHRKA